MQKRFLTDISAQKNKAENISSALLLLITIIDFILTQYQFICKY